MGGKRHSGKTMGRAKLDVLIADYPADTRRQTSVRWPFVGRCTELSGYDSDTVELNLES